VREAFDWKSARVYDKIDGTLVMAFWYRGKWNFATRKMADAGGPVGDYDMTFAELIHEAMKEMNFSSSELDTDYYYAFELTTPLNKIVVSYTGYKLTLLAARNRFSQAEVDISTLPEITIPKVKLLPLSNLDDIMEMIGKLAPSEGEGVVVVDDQFRRMKIKSPEYLKSFRAVMTAEASPRNKIAILMSDAFDDIYSMLTQSLKDDLDELKLKFETMASMVAADYAKIAGIEEQKAFAAEALKTKYSSWIFAIRKGYSIEEIMMQTRPKKIQEMIERIL
jgi:hypothetical protein